MIVNAAFPLQFPYISSRVKSIMPLYASVCAFILRNVMVNAHHAFYCTILSSNNTLSILCTATSVFRVLMKVE